MRLVALARRGRARVAPPRPAGRAPGAGRCQRRGGPGGAQRPRARDRRARGRPPHERPDRREALPERQDGREPPAQHLPQARRELARRGRRSEEHTSELQSRQYLVCRLLLEKKKKSIQTTTTPLTPPLTYPTH